MNLQPSYDIRAIQAEHKAESKKFQKVIDLVRDLQLHPDKEAEIIAILGIAYDVRTENITVRHMNAKKAPVVNDSAAQAEETLQKAQLTVGNIPVTGFGNYEAYGAASAQIDNVKNTTP